MRREPCRSSRHNVGLFNNGCFDRLSQLVKKCSLIKNLIVEPMVTVVRQAHQPVEVLGGTTNTNCATVPMFTARSFRAISALPESGR